MTSIWWATQLLMNWSMVNVRGTPSTRASMLAGEVGLQLGVLEQVVEHHPGHGVALEHDHQPLAGARGGVVTHVGDALHPAGVGELGDLERQVVGVDHVGQLGDHQAGAALAVLVDLDDRTLGDRAAAGAVGLLDALRPTISAALGKSGPLIRSMSASWSSSRVASGCSSAHWAPSATSRRLWGGMLVAMPTAMPAEPLTSRLGNRAGRIVGSALRPS
jgi:hypothetical protein